MTDGKDKPTAIMARIGKTPIFCASNVRTGGDIAHQSYCASNALYNYQLLINHNDDICETAYAEADNASIQVAKEGSWHIVSMKNDWLRIFPEK